MAESKRSMSDKDSTGRRGSDSGKGGSKDSRREDEELEATKEDIILDSWQREALEHKGHILLCTGRQSGKTFLMARKCSKYLLEHPKSRIIVVSLTEDQAELIIIMILDYLQKYHKKRIAKKKKAPTKKRVILTNGASVLARPVGNTGDAVRGFTGNVLVIDEASRMPEAAFTAAKPTLLTTGGEIWMCSTPFGKQGYFYECYQNKHKRFKVIHTNCEEVMQNRTITSVWTNERKEGALRLLEEEKLDMSELQYAQEYLGKFIDDLRQLFTDAIIDASCILSGRSSSFPKDFFLGVDIARMGEDESTFETVQRLEQDKIQHIENIVTRKTLTTDTFDRIVQLNRRYNYKQIGIDAGSGSLGVGILDFLLREPTVRKKVIALNSRRVIQDHRKKIKVKLLNEHMYLHMLALMEKGTLKLLDDGNVRLSLKSVQYEYVRREGQQTKIRIFGKYNHIVEGLMRAIWLANQKHLNLQITYI